MHQGEGAQRMTGQARRPPLIVFTDLDGCLLDHETYEFAPALPALERLRRLEIPVVLTSSKTLTELLVIRAALGLDHPLIAETGAVVALTPGLAPVADLGESEGLVIELRSAPYPAIRSQLAALRREFGFRFEGFGDWDAEQVSQLTGLSREEALRAKERLASEPVFWRDAPDALEEFRRRLAEQSLQVIEGGRFLHVLGQADKGRALRSVLDRYETRLGMRPCTLALGDSPNDREMLSAADRAAIVHNPHSPSIEVSHLPDALCTHSAGPLGWREAVERVLDELEVR